jgi:putative glycosyltransferase (TIGR04348 family)
MARARIVIVTPALAAANNGNWQTAARWRRFLAGEHAVRLTDRWEGGDEDLMIALHARRSAGCVAAWRAAFPRRPLLLVLTGTDLYRDIDSDVSAQASLRAADRLVVLNALGRERLPPEHRGKAVVCLQSAPSRQAPSRTTRHTRFLMVGHLRDEKSPHTFFEAVRALRGRGDLRFDHIGAGLDAALAAEAQALMAADPHYRWLGALPHGETRRRIAGAHALVHASRMEGGAHVVIEAVVSGTPVLASRIDGNVGMLGRAYGGYFDWGDSPALARLMQRLHDDSGFAARLQAQVRQLAPRFAPATEQAALRRQVAELLAPRRARR